MIQGFTACITSPYAPEMLWEWEEPQVGRLLWNTTTFGRELAHQYFPTRKALVQENERIWTNLLSVAASLSALEDLVGMAVSDHRGSNHKPLILKG